LQQKALCLGKKFREWQANAFQAKLRPCFVIGNDRMRSPVAVKIALQTAGRIGGKAGWPSFVSELLVFPRLASR
jgi:hypothetical protein